MSKTGSQTFFRRTVRDHGASKSVAAADSCRITHEYIRSIDMRPVLETHRASERTWLVHTYLIDYDYFINWEKKKSVQLTLSSVHGWGPAAIFSDICFFAFTSSNRWRRGSARHAWVHDVVGQVSGEKSIEALQHGTHSAVFRSAISVWFLP